MFDPKLSQGFGFNQPTAPQQSLVGVIGGLFQGAMDVEQALRPNQEAPKLTEDEKFATDWANFVNSKGAAFELDRKAVREFIFTHPQHDPSKVISLYEGVGGISEDPVERAVDAGLTKYESDPGYIVAATEAMKLPESEREGYMLSWMATKAQEDAEIEKINRDKSRLEAEGFLFEKQWEAIGARRKRYVDAVTSMVLEPILSDISSGLSVQLTPEQQAELGVTYNTVTIDNIGAVLRDTKRFLEEGNLEEYYAAYGADSDVLPPKEWEDRVLAGINSLIEVVDQFDSPQEKLNALNAFIETGAIKKLDKAGLSTMQWFLQNLPQDVTTRFLRTPEGMDIMRRFSTILMPNGLPTESIAEKVGKQSSNEAEQIAKDGMALMAQGASNLEIFQATVAGMERAGFGVTDSSAFTTMVGKSSDWMKKKASEDPDAKLYMQEWFVSDINQTVTSIRRQLGPGVELMYQNGRYTVIPLPGGVAQSGGGIVDRLVVDTLGMFTPEELIEASQKRLPEGLKVEDLNKKLAALKTLGPLGQEVIDVVIGQGLSGGAGQDSIRGGAGNDTLGFPSSLIRTESGGNFAAKNSVAGAGGKGHFGRLQFSRARLNEAQAAGVMPKGMTPQEFLNNPKVQVAVEQWHFDDIRKFAQANDLTKYIGSTIRGVPVTMDGMLAVAHLGGKGGLKKFLESGGQYNPSDAFGTSLLDYLNTHQGSSGMVEGEVPMEPASLVGATATGLPVGQTINAPKQSEPQPAQPAQGVVMAPLASPQIEQKIAEAQDREALKTQAMELLAKKPVDREVADLIKALIGVSNA